MGTIFFLMAVILSLVLWIILTKDKDRDDQSDDDNEGGGTIRCIPPRISNFKPAS